MLLNNTCNDSIPYEPTSAAHTDLDSIIDDVAKQMAFSKMIRPQFRDSCSPSASYGQRGGVVSRITKPASAGSSPSRVGRRRSMLSESTSRTRSTLYSHFENVFNLTSSRDRLPQEPVTPRPVSWQPTSGQDQWAPSHQVYDNPSFDMSTDYRFSTGSFGLTYLEEPEMQSLFPCSDPVSPLSSMAPSGDPAQLYDQQVYGLADACYTQQVELAHSDVQYPPQVPSSPLLIQSTQMIADGPSDQYLELVNSQQDWSQFVYGSGAFFPFTPSQTQTPFPMQSSIPSAQTAADHPSQPNLDSPGGTKELIGMGLYDAPDSSTPALEPDDYRNSIISTMSYLDSDCPGKGLKLEETWKPAESDDDDDDDDDDEESSTTDDSHDAPCSTVERQEEGLNNAMVDNSVILPHDGLFDEETYLAASAILTQSKTQGVSFDGLPWI